MDLFRRDPQVLNVGLSSFRDSIARAGGAVAQIEWAPPANGDRSIGRALARLVNDSAVEAANRAAFQAYLAAQPVLTGIGAAVEVVIGLYLAYVGWVPARTRAVPRPASSTPDLPRAA